MGHVGKDMPQLQVVAPRGVARTFDADALVARWHADMAERVAAGELSPTTASTYARGMRRFLAWRTAAGKVGGVGPDVLRQWKADMARAGRTPAGVNVQLAGVRAFFRWAVTAGALAYNPTLDVKGHSRRSKRHRREPLSDEEVLRVLAQPDASTPAGKRDRALLYVLAYTGARSVEAQRARVGDLHSGRMLALDVHGKGRAEADERLYIAHPQAVDAIYAWLAVHPCGRDAGAPLFCGLGNRNMGGPLGLSSIRRLVTGYYRAAGIRNPRKTTHSLRHAFVSNLIGQGISPVKIQSATRHRSIDTLLIYAHELERDSDPAEAHVNYG